MLLSRKCKRNVTDIMGKQSSTSPDMTQVFALFTKAKRKRSYSELISLLERPEYCHTADGQNLLGYCYHLGLGVTQDYQKARSLYLAAARQGHLDALYTIAVLSEHGLGGKKNAKQAFYFYLQAARGGVVDAQCNLGTLYFDGIGVHQDTEQGFLWLQRAARAGDKRAQFNLGMALFDLKKTRSLRSAKRWFQKAADQGHKRASSMLRRLL